MLLVAAYGYAILTGVAGVFQLCLAAGAPWGHLAMGGKFPGKYSPGLRVLAVVQGAILWLMGGIVLTRAGVIFPEWSPLSQSLIWAVLAFTAFSTVANLATPSKPERMLWGPVTVAMLACCLVVAFGAPAAT